MASPGLDVELISDADWEFELEVSRTETGSTAQCDGYFRATQGRGAGQPRSPAGWKACPTRLRRLSILFCESGLRSPIDLRLKFFCGNIAAALVLAAILFGVLSFLLEFLDLVVQPLHFLA